MTTATEELRAYHGDEKLKKETVAKARWHKDFSEFTRNEYFSKNGKTKVCAVGCKSKGERRLRFAPSTPAPGYEGSAEHRRYVPAPAASTQPVSESPGDSGVVAVFEQKLQEAEEEGEGFTVTASYLREVVLPELRRLEGVRLTRPVHRCFIERRSRWGWRAECSCGWMGRKRWHPLLADREADTHLSASTQPVPGNSGGVEEGR